MLLSYRFRHIFFWARPLRIVFLALSLEYKTKNLKMIQNIWLQRFEVDKSSDEIEKRKKRNRKKKQKFSRIQVWVNFEEIRRLKFRKVIEEEWE
jgi:hypothetical protein